MAVLAERLVARPKTSHERLEGLSIEVLARAQAAADEGKAKPRSFRMRAYSGAPFGRLWVIDGKAKLVQLCIDLAGIEAIEKRGLPMLIDHGRNPKYSAAAGVARSSECVTAEEAEDEDEIGYWLEGNLLEDEEGAHVASLADQGFPWTASVGVLRLEEVELKSEKDELEVNGFKLKGPDVFVWRRSSLYETSFIHAGPADSRTGAEVMMAQGDLPPTATNGTPASSAPAATATATQVDREALKIEILKEHESKRRAFVESLVKAGAKKSWARGRFDDGATIVQAHEEHAQLMKASFEEAGDRVDHEVRKNRLTPEDGKRVKAAISRGHDPERQRASGKRKGRVLDRLELQRAGKGKGKLAQLSRADRRILAELAESYDEWAEASDHGLFLRTVFPRHMGGPELLRCAQLAEEAGEIRVRASAKGIPFAPPYSIEKGTVEALAARLIEGSETFSGHGMTEQLASTWGKDANSYSFMTVKGYLAALFKPLEDDLGAGFAQRVGMMVASNQPEEDYRTLGPPPQVRKWIGMRRTPAIPNQELKIPNDTYEGTVDFGLNDLRFDKSGQISMRMSELGVRGSQHWDVLGTQVLLQNQTCLDGLTLFNANHTWGGGYLNSNIATAANVPALAVSNPVWPTQQEMAAAIMGVIQAFYPMQDQTGSPLNGSARRFCVVVPPNLWAPAMTAVRAARLNFGQDNPLPLQDFSVDVIPLGWLVTSLVGNAGNTSTFYVFRTDSAARSIILQDVTGWEAALLGPGSDLTTVTDRVLFGIRGVRGAGAGYWEHVIQATLS